MSTKQELLATIKARIGFLVEEDLRLLVEYEPARVCLLRFGGTRKLVRADQVEETIKRVETAGDYLRDVSLPTTDPIWTDDPIIGRNRR